MKGRIVSVLALVLVAGFPLSLAEPVGAAGNSITSPDTVSFVGNYTSLALDATGNPVVSYYDVTNGNLKVLHCNDPNCAGGGESVAAPDASIDDVGYFTSLALDSTGNPVVSYYDITNKDLKILHCDDPNCAGNESGNIALPDTAGDVGYDTSLALDAGGNPLVSYRDVTNENLKVLDCGNANCTAGNSVTSPDTVGDVGHHTSLVVDCADFDPDARRCVSLPGKAVVSYLERGTDGNLKVLHCGNASCTASNSITSPDTAGDVGRYTSLALDEAGNPVVSYYDDVPNFDLKVLHCNDPNCAGDESANITSPDTAGSVGVDTSLTLDDAGNPVVSYYDSINDDLKVLHCNDPNCAGGGESITTPDATGLVGRESSIVLDATAFPVVSYYDSTNGDLKVLHCVDPVCKGTPLGVGGVADAPEIARAALEAPGSSRLSVALAGIAAAAAGGAVVLGGAAWYGRKSRGS